MVPFGLELGLIPKTHFWPEFSMIMKNPNIVVLLYAPEKDPLLTQRRRSSLG